MNVKMMTKAEEKEIRKEETAYKLKKIVINRSGVAEEKEEKELTLKEVASYLRRFFGAPKPDFRISKQYVALSGTGSHVVIVYYYCDTLYSNLNNKYLKNVIGVQYNCIDISIDNYHFIIYWKPLSELPPVTSHRRTPKRRQEDINHVYKL